MADGHCEQAWAHTSAVLALIANANRDKKKRGRPFSAADFDPYATESKATSGIPVTRANIGVLKAFVQESQSRGPRSGNVDRKGR